MQICMAMLGMAGLITHWPPSELQPPAANVSGGRAPLRAIAGMLAARWSAEDPPPRASGTIGGITLPRPPPPGGSAIRSQWGRTCAPGIHVAAAIGKRTSPVVRGAATTLASGAARARRHGA